MKRDATGRDKSSAADIPEHEAVPKLPAWKAFVVQFTRETTSAEGDFAGRVEHLSSGRRVRFDSPAELVSRLSRLLEEIGHEQESRGEER